jgi:catechol 2,3-dioxygenase-like lactoylglutathione lyase family enzyme
MADGVGIDRFLHVKVPVGDVERSARWYADLLDMRLDMEFVEEDELRGVELVEPISGFHIALRDRAHSASTPVLAGFDLFALDMTSLEALQAVADRCDRLGIGHSGVHQFHGGAGLDVPDPDGTVIRFHFAPGRPPFMGARSDGEGGYSLYDSPRLRDLPVMET